MGRKKAPLITVWQFSVANSINSVVDMLIKILSTDILIFIKT